MGTAVLSVRHAGRHDCVHDDGGTAAPRPLPRGAEAAPPLLCRSVGGQHRAGRSTGLADDCGGARACRRAAAADGLASAAALLALRHARPRAAHSRRGRLSVAALCLLRPHRAGLGDGPAAAQTTPRGRAGSASAGVAPTADRRVGPTGAPTRLRRDARAAARGVVGTADGANASPHAPTPTVCYRSPARRNAGRAAGRRAARGCRRRNSGGLRTRRARERCALTRRERPGQRASRLTDARRTAEGRA